MKIILDEKRTISTSKPLPYEGEKYYSQAGNKLPGEKGSRFMVLGGKVPLANEKGECAREGDSVRQPERYIGHKVIPPRLYERFSLLHKKKNPKDTAFLFIKEWGLLGLAPLWEGGRQLGVKKKMHRAPWDSDYPPESLQKVVEESKRFSTILSLYAIVQRYYREHKTLTRKDRERTLNLLKAYEKLPPLIPLPDFFETKLTEEDLEELSTEKLISIAKKSVIRRTIEWYTDDLQFSIYFPEDSPALETRILNAGLLAKMYIQFTLDASEGVRFVECPVCGKAMAVHREDRQSHKECGSKEREERFTLNLFTRSIKTLRKKGREVTLTNIKEETLKLRPGKSYSLKKIKNVLEESKVKIDGRGKVLEPEEALKALQREKGEY